MKRFKKTRKVWLGKRHNSVYEIGAAKKYWNPIDGFHIDSGRFIAGFCSSEFESVTGIRLDKGEIVKVTITVEAV